MVKHIEKIRRIQKRLEEKRVEMHNKMGKDISQALNEAYSKIENTVKEYEKVLESATKDSLPENFKEKIEQLPAKIYSEMGNLGRTLISHKAYASLAEKLLNNSYMMFGEFLEYVTDKENRIKAVNQISGYKGSRSSPRWEIFENHPWFKGNKDLLMGLNSYQIRDLTSRKMSKICFLTFLRETITDSETSPENKTKAKEFFREIMNTPYKEEKKTILDKVVDYIQIRM